jgi:hypothetical protein
MGLLNLALTAKRALSRMLGITHLFQKVFKRPPVRAALFAVSVVVLGGCNTLPEFALIDGAMVLGTDKTLGDHVYSLYTGKNCATVRKERGQVYCVDDELNPSPVVYCYPTLGKVTCYDKPNPYNGRQKRVAESAPALNKNENQ